MLDAQPKQAFLQTHYKKNFSTMSSIKRRYYYKYNKKKYEPQICDFLIHSNFNFASNFLLPIQKYFLHIRLKMNNKFLSPFFES